MREMDCCLCGLLGLGRPVCWPHAMQAGETLRFFQAVVKKAAPLAIYGWIPSQMGAGDGD